MTTYQITQKPLSGHDSPDTAYTATDYPYGYKLRTTIRYWIETKKAHGQRFVSQTVNPKTGHWNKPKTSTYAPLVFLALDDQDHIVNQSLSEYANSETLEMYALWAVGHLTEWQIGSLDYLRAIRRANDRVTITIHTCEPGCSESHQTREEGNQIMARAVSYEMRNGGL